MTKQYLRIGCALVIATLSFASLHLAGEDVVHLSPSQLEEKLFTPQMLPTIQLQGRFEFFSAYDGDSLEPSTSADFKGEIDLADRTTHFDFHDYRSPVAHEEPALHAFYSVTFDGDKWLVVDSGSRINGVPKGITAMGTITSNHPYLFLKSLDQLCFPLFTSLLNVQVGVAKVASLKDVLEGKVAGVIVDTRSEGNSIIVTVRGDGATDEYSFDTTKTYAMTHRRTDFGQKVNPTDNYIVNELTVTEFIHNGGMWFPSVAEFTQTVNGKLMVKRDYSIKEISPVLDAKPIAAVIPPNIYVRDERTGTSYRSDAAAN